MSGSEPDLTITVPRKVALDVLWDIDAMASNGETVSPSMAHLAGAIQELVGYDEYQRHSEPGRR